MSHSQEVTMTYSTPFKGEDGKKSCRVRFERKVAGKLQAAEGLLPRGIIEKSNGYSKEEIAQLEEYLKNHSQDILNLASSIKNPLLNM
ncbi:MAG: hypothetical protein VZR32_05630 [Candidatus Weimeria sp.]|nr:hypothetical protein [Candidatus Weimeria sp.]